MNLTDSAQFVTYGMELAVAVEEAVPGWLRRSVYWHLAEQVAEETFDRQALDRRLDEVGQAAVVDIGSRLRKLLERDVDDQWTNPMSIIRSIVSYPTEVLIHYGAPTPDRSAHDIRMFPDDSYDLTPANFATLGPDVHECGIRWGAAKAHLHLQRHKKGRKQ